MHHIDQSVVEATALLSSPWVMHITDLIDAVFKMLTETFYVAATVTHFKPSTLREFGRTVAGGPKVPQEGFRGEEGWSGAWKRLLSGGQSGVCPQHGCESDMAARSLRTRSFLFARISRRRPPTLLRSGPGPLWMPGEPPSLASERPTRDEYERGINTLSRVLGPKPIPRVHRVVCWVGTRCVLVVH